MKFLLFFSIEIRINLAQRNLNRKCVYTNSFYFLLCDKIILEAHKKYKEESHVTFHKFHCYYIFTSLENFFFLTFSILFLYRFFRFITTSRIINIVEL